MPSHNTALSRDQQIPVPPILLTHFLRQIEGAHIDTPHRRPVPLHYNAETGTLVHYPWPCDSETRQRITPSELESFRRTHHFRGPSCLCAYLDGDAYSEARIGLVEVKTADRDRNMSVLHGEYVAVCGKQRCGYTLCLERFYSLNFLRLRYHKPRDTPLPLQELVHISDIDQSFRTGDGLFQVMSNVVIRARAKRITQVCPKARREKDILVKKLSQGVPESQFWATFAQCIHCKNVMLRDGIQAYHTCNLAERNHKRFRPYTPSRGSRAAGMVEATLRRTIGDIAEIRDMPSLRSSPAPTEIVSDRDVADLEVTEDEGDDNADGSDDDTDEDAQGSDDPWTSFPDPASDTEFPTVLSILRGEA